jgi:hypothetical protein
VDEAIGLAGRSALFAGKTMLVRWLAQNGGGAVSAAAEEVYEALRAQFDVPSRWRDVVDGKEVYRGDESHIECIGTRYYQSRSDKKLADCTMIDLYPDGIPRALKVPKRQIQNAMRSLRSLGQLETDEPPRLTFRTSTEFYATRRRVYRIKASFFGFAPRNVEKHQFTLNQ